MTNDLTLNLGYALPEIVLAAMACLVLLIEAIFAEKGRHTAFVVAIASLLLTAWLSAMQYGGEVHKAFSDMYVADNMAAVLKAIINLMTVAIFVNSRRYLTERGLFRGDYYVLGMFAVLGMMIMVSSSTFLVLYMGLELQALSLYVMVAYYRDSVQSSEAAMKYFVLGALSSGIFLYGISLLYGLSAGFDFDGVRAASILYGAKSPVMALALVMVVVALAFKIGAVPFHMWIPDVYQGSPTPTTVFIATAPKLAAFAVFYRVLVEGMAPLIANWQLMFIILAVLSIAVGNVAAIAQTNLKRMLGYSTIAHMGFFLLGFLTGNGDGYAAAMFYMLVYTFMALGAFGVILLLARKDFEADELVDMKGLSQRHPWHAFLMLLLMISMSGIPPTIGFYAKLNIIQALLNVGMVWLAVVAVLLAVIGAFYYLRVIKLMYFDSPETELAGNNAMDEKILVSGVALSVVAILPWIGTIIDLVYRLFAT